MVAKKTAVQQLASGESTLSGGSTAAGTSGGAAVRDMGGRKSMRKAPTGSAARPVKTVRPVTSGGAAADERAAGGRAGVSQAGAKKAGTAKKAGATKGAAKQVGARKGVASKAAASKKVSEEKRPGTPVVEKAAGRKAAVKRTAAKKPAAKKRAAASGGIGKSASTTGTAKKSATKKAGAAQAAKTTGATTVVAKKTPGTATAAKKPTAVPKARVAAGEPGELAVRPGEDPWTQDEVTEARTELQSEAMRLRSELDASERALMGLMRDSGDGAGDDQADTGTKNITREHELALAHNAREMLDQTERALERLDTGTYGLCENCGNPIGKARMQAFPRATLCVECKQKQERR